MSARKTKAKFLGSDGKHHTRRSINEAYCKELFSEYQALKNRTRMGAYDPKFVPHIEPPYIKHQDIARRKELAGEIVSVYKEHFRGKPSEWRELERDAPL